MSRGIRLGVGIFLSGLMLVGTYTNCGRVLIQLPGQSSSPSVTSVGNPVQDENARNLMTAICKRLSSCLSGLSANHCWNGVLNTTGLAEATGLPPGVFSNFREVVLAESQKKISGSEERVELCGQQAETLACTDSAIVGAYQPGTPQPFAGVAQILNRFPTTCGATLSCSGSGCTPSPSPSPASLPSPSVLPAPSPSMAAPSCGGPGTQFGLQYCTSDVVTGGNAPADCCSGSWHPAVCISDPYCPGGQVSCLQHCD